MLKKILAGLAIDDEPVMQVGVDPGTSVSLELAPATPIDEQSLDWCALMIDVTLSMNGCVPDTSEGSAACAICRAITFSAVRRAVQWS